MRAFETDADQYEAWFEHNAAAYQSELQAVRQLLPGQGDGIEIGAGSGRFSAPLGIRFGIEPARSMAQKARKRGIDVIRGIGEILPFRDERFDFALMVTTLCFLDNPEKAFFEIHRILRPEGAVLIGFLDKQSILGRIYLINKAKSRFYREAEFYSADGVRDLLIKTGFSQITAVQTLFSPLEMITRVEPVQSGTGDGSFVVVKANK